MASSLTPNGLRPSLSRVASGLPNGGPAPPVIIAPQSGENITDAVLELADGTAFRGISFGADGKSVAGECVFQTGEYHLGGEAKICIHTTGRYGRLYRVLDGSIL